MVPRRIAIDSNDLDTLRADVTDDIVYQSPNEPPIAGKAASSQAQELQRWLAF